MVRTLRRSSLDTNLTKWLSVKAHFRRAKRKDNYKVANNAAERETRSK